MQVIYSKEYDPNTPTVTTVGVFDGVHKGHKKIIHFVNEIAKKKNLLSCLLTFEPHPRFVINTHNDFKLLTPLNEKIDKLHSLHLNVLIIQKFNSFFQKLSYEKFVENILIQKLNVDTLVIGHDHLFGKNREGNFKQLSHLSKNFNFELIQLPAIKNNENIISSTKIRHALIEGNLTAANDFLGDCYTISGEVIPGLGIGKHIGFPTANLSVDKEKLIPKKGVYFVEISVVGSFSYFGMMNIGNRPTFRGKSNQIEVHIFDFSNDLYGKQISVQLKSYIREEIQFDSTEKLAHQIKKDKHYIQTHFLNRL